MKTFTNTHTLLYHINDSISIPLRYSIIEGTTWFVGKDVAAICGYKDTWKAIKYHVSPENIDHIILDGHKHIIINFSGFEQLAPDKKPVNWFVNNNIATFTEEKSVSEPPTVFTHPQFGTVRTVEIDNEVWFVGKDVAEALGYSDPRSAISKKIENEDRGVAKMATLPEHSRDYHQRIRSLLSHPQQQAFISKRVQALGYSRGAPLYP